jgi:hypothetical protein
LRGENIVGGMRDKNRVIPGIEHAILFNKVKKIGHLLEIGRHIGVITGEMDVVEFHINHVLDFS